MLEFQRSREEFHHVLNERTGFTPSNCNADSESKKNKIMCADSSFLKQIHYDHHHHHNQPFVVIDLEFAQDEKSKISLASV